MPLVEIEKGLQHWMKSILSATSSQELVNLKIGLIGKSGVITTAFKMLKTVSADEKKNLGEKLNKIKNKVEEAIAEQLGKLNNCCTLEKLENETLDITLPIGMNTFGGAHIISQSIKKIRNHYLSRGFLVLDGPEIETDFFNFDALNMPSHHPARQSHDTFYLKGFKETLLRTHTSCSQIRTMKEKGIPIRMISIGKTYRNDQLDATHSPMFHQVECLVADRAPITIGHLKNELRKFISFFFGVESIAIRFRPSFFPFVEPGVEVDCRYTKKDGKLIVTEKGDKWIELGGAGMVHPNVFKYSGITGQAYGFAFGLGIDRFVMLKNGITDIRNLFDTDQRWLRHYGT
ncbi:MAG: phenylalanine--tRNA ligase subunit alpha [Holosporales bacterium]|nr:phenylalanine--tRNA ligase subunit alpha [Holosporales bacterium]